MLQLVKEEGNIVFIDEAVYSSKLGDQKVWALPGPDRPTISIEKVNFKAIAVTAGVDVEGRIFGEYLCDFSVNVERFIEFLIVLREKARPGQLYVVLDNLRVHHSRLVRDHCQKHEMTLVIAASYSSQFMPAEQIWCLSKR